MAYTAPRDNREPIDCRAELQTEPDEFGRLLGPIMAGARARGVADAFELMGLAAVLIDSSGRVLHASGRAERALLPLVRIAEGHLVGADAPTNASLQAVIATAIGSSTVEPAEHRFDFTDPDGHMRMSVTAIRFPDDDTPAVQLLRGVLVVTEYER